MLYDVPTEHQLNGEDHESPRLHEVVMVLIRETTRTVKNCKRSRTQLSQNIFLFSFLPKNKMKQKVIPQGNQITSIIY